MAGAVIQATGRLIFEDGMRPFVGISGPKGVVCVRTSLSEAVAASGAPEGSGIGDN